MNTNQISAEKQTILDMAAKHGITMAVKFVPWSTSRNANEKRRSLNWKVTLSKGNSPILTTDYMAGEGHCPAYNDGYKPGTLRTTVDRDNAIKAECETGKTKLGKAILPDMADVIHSLVSDADVINYPTYESWASEFGFDEDSRKGEATYRACLKIALKLRAALGENGLAELRESCEGY